MSRNVADELRSEDTMDAADIIDDDGRIDARTLDAPDPNRGEYTHVTAETCAETRRRLLDGATVYALGNGDEFDHPSTSLRRHARGECSHEHDGPPPLRHAGSGSDGKWVVRDE